MARDQLRSETHGRTLVVYVGADYDSLNDESLRDLRTQLLSFTELPDAENLIIDLSNTKFIGSSFIEVLFRSWHRIKRKGGQFALSGLQPYPAEVIRISKLDALWPLYPSAREAVQGMAAPQGSTK